MRKLISVVLLTLIATGLPAQNILTNGGFESGLMCWEEWVVSSTLVDGAGDYRFAVSSDTRPGSSGANSIEIECEGTDCYKAYIYTDEILAPANQAYQMNYWAKCPSGGTVYVGPPGNPLAPSPGNPEIYGYASCDGTWHLNSVTFNSNDPAFAYPSSPADGYIRIALNVFNQTAWVLFDDVTLTYGDGMAPQQVVLHPGTRNLSISGQTLNVDGAPYLSLGFFNVDYADLPQVAAMGATTVNGSGYSYNSADCFNTGQKSYMDLAYELGLGFVPDSTATARLANTSVMAAARQNYAPHLANIAWLLAGEPDLWSWPFFIISPENLIADYTAAKAQSPVPLVPYFQRAAYDASALPPFNGAEDIWMAEPFGSNFSTTAFAINLFNSVQTRPIWLALDNIGTLNVPKAYYAVIQGVTGIHYFDWGQFKADPVGLAAAGQVFTELNGLKNAIFAQKTDALVTAPPNIVSMSRFDPNVNTFYILSANGATQNISGLFHVQGISAGQKVTVLNENRTITARAGAFSDTFSGISRHVYTIQTTAPTVTFTGAPASAHYGAQFSVAATTNATTAPSITASGACTISGTTVTMTSGTGTCVLNAAWGADGTYSATTATQYTNASKITPTITWAAPANLVFGSALSAVQLNASASVPGTFTYTPAGGSVLPVGAGQTLSVTFTPNDTTDYGGASGSTTITVTPATTPVTPANLVVTKILSRTGGNVVVAITIANTGGSTATNVALSSVKIGSVAGAPVPQTVGSIAAGSSAQVSVTVPGSVGASGAASTLAIGGTYTGGTFSSSARISLP